VWLTFYNLLYFHHNIYFPLAGLVDVQKMGYGSRAIDLLSAYFQHKLGVDEGQGVVQGLSHVTQIRGLEVGDLGQEGEMVGEEEANGREESQLATEDIRPKSKLPPLLTPIVDHPAERLHWLGVSFGLTPELLNFWSRKRYRMCYIRQTRNELTGEHSAVMLRELDCRGMKGECVPRTGWLKDFTSDFQSRIMSLLSFTFRHLDASVSLSLVDPDKRVISSSPDGEVDVTRPGHRENNQGGNESRSGKLTGSDILAHFLTAHDMKRLELYSRSMVDHHMVLDLLPTLSRLVFSNRLEGVHLSALQAVILLGIGLQHRDVDSISEELKLPSSQILAFFNKTVRKISNVLRSYVEADVVAELKLNERVEVSRMEEAASHMNALVKTLDDEHEEDKRAFKESQRREQRRLKDAGIEEEEEEEVDEGGGNGDQEDGELKHKHVKGNSGHSAADQTLVEKVMLATKSELSRHAVKASDSEIAVALGSQSSKKRIIESDATAEGKGDMVGKVFSVAVAAGKVSGGSVSAAKDAGEGTESAGVQDRSAKFAKSKKNRSKAHRFRDEDVNEDGLGNDGTGVLSVNKKKKKLKRTVDGTDGQQE